MASRLAGFSGPLLPPEGGGGGVLGAAEASVAIRRGSTNNDFFMAKRDSGCRNWPIKKLATHPRMPSLLTA